MCLLFAVEAADAVACNEPALFVPQTRAQAGDPVSYSVSGTEEGATYTLQVDGATLGQFSDTDPALGTSGSFTMPDVGNSARSGVEIDVLVTHEGNEWLARDFIDYEVPAPAPPPAPPAGNTPPPATTNTDGSNAAGVDSQHSNPVRSSGQRDATGNGSGNGDGANGASTPVPNLGAVPSAASATSGSSSATATEGARVDASTGAAAHSTPAGARKDSIVDSRDAVAPAAGRLSRRAEVGEGDKTSAAAIAAGGLTLLAAIAAAWVLILRRRGRPDEGYVPAEAPLWTPPPIRAEADWRSAVIEAGLQEMIAEERAKVLLSSPETTALAESGAGDVRNREAPDHA